jgi:class 3 adenylate cyclase
MRFYIRNNITDDAYTLEYKKSIGKKRKTLDKYLLNKLDRKETSEDRVVNEKFSIEKKIEETDKELLNGFIIFIDLCNSTSFKQLMQEEWFDRLIHFYKSSEEYLRDILKEFEKNVYFLKYIGDEVMFFIEDKSLKNNSKFLKAILTYLKSVRDNMNTVYFINKNEERSVIAYEKNEKKIDIKTCITYVEKVKKYKINDSQFDILGTPVDFSARLMSLCKENIIVCNHDFVELLSDSNHSKDFKNLGKFNLHGFDENYEKNQDVYIYDYNNVMSIIDNKYLDDNSEIKKDLIGRLFLKVHNIK